ncbi:MAG: type III pantothenate kinase [Bacteroidota bacterium]
MNLIIDLGNTFHKIAIVDHDVVVEVCQFSGMTEIDLENIFKKYHPQKAILSSVIKADNHIKNWLKNNLPYIEMSSQLKLPFKINYLHHETLGTDRIAAVVGGRCHVKEGNLLVIQAGSCVTFDLIDASNIYRGGSISPGILMRLNALHQFTKKLPLVEFQSIDDFCGNSTKASILAGVTCGIASEIEGMIIRYQEKYEQLSIILTGGSIKYFDKWLKNSNFANPNLVIEGLNTILNIND